MAEIGIEKKKPIWPWIILVLVILAILYFLFFADGDETDDLEDTNTEQVEDTTSAWGTEARDAGDTLTGNYGQGVQAYISHVGDKSRMGIDHEYTNNALIQLRNAVESKAREENVDIEADMQEVRQTAEEITQDPQSTQHANKIKSAGENLTNALEKIQQEKYPDLSSDVEDVRNALQEIDPSVQTLEQKDNVNSFFDEAADLLQKMS